MMKIKQKIISVTHSVITKLIGLIILLALAIILTIYTFAQFILSERVAHDSFILISIVVFIFSLAIYFVHRILLPVNELNKGVKEISSGNLDVQLKVRSKDEIGKLAEAFNQMTKDLNAMINSREQLLLDVSHELRTPITRTLLALEMLEESEYVTTAKRNLMEVQVMIKELLESHRLMSGQNELNISDLYLNNLIQTIAEDYNNRPPGIIIHPIRSNIFILADEELIKIVFRNIIDNALKYSGEQISPVEISVIDKNNQTLVVFEDSGQGIEPSEIDKVFEPFFRIDKSRSRKTGGYGLGLHMCKKIMEAHKGSIRLSNKSDKSGLKVILSFYKDNTE